ncbi:MAG: hypothetical protein VXZ09_17365 [Pseudomonadota bacterium]|nr:hypothetical protein [Pseudomonadota bacterium]
MKVILILVVFSFEAGSGSEAITAQFNDLGACDSAAARTFQGLDAGVDLRPLVPAEGAELIDGTMIAYGAEGGEIGMYSCNPVRTSIEGS